MEVFCMKSIKEVQEFIKNSCDKYGYVCYTKDTEGMENSFRSAVKGYENADDNSILIVISYFKRALISGIIVDSNKTIFTVTLRDNQMEKDFMFVVTMKNGKEEECFKKHFLEEMVNVGFLTWKQIKEKKQIPTGYNFIRFSEETFNKMLNDITHKRKIKPFDIDYENHNACIIMNGFVDSEETISVAYEVYIKDGNERKIESKTSALLELVDSLEETVSDLDNRGYLNPSDVPECVLDVTYNVLGKTDFNKVLTEIQKLYESNN